MPRMKNQISAAGAVVLVCASILIAQTGGCVPGHTIDLKHAEYRHPAVRWVYRSSRRLVFMHPQAVVLAFSSGVPGWPKNILHAFPHISQYNIDDLELGDNRCVVFCEYPGGMTWSGSIRIALDLQTGRRVRVVEARPLRRVTQRFWSDPLSIRDGAGLVRLLEIAAAGDVRHAFEIPEHDVALVVLKDESNPFPPTHYGSLIVCVDLTKLGE